MAPAARNQSVPGMTRVLHVVYNMNVGGIETWLMHVLRHMDRDAFRMDFLVNTTEPCAYDEEIRSLGSAIIAAPNPLKHPQRFGRAFKRILAARGPYDVVHCHLRVINGLIVRLAHQAGVPVRIAHMHNVAQRGKTPGLAARVLMSVVRGWLRKHMTAGLGASREACACLFGSEWETDTRVRVLHCGVDFSPFHAPVSSADVRRELGLPDDAFVVGHVGRFGRQKNHDLFLDIAADLAARDGRVHFLLVGDGDLRPHIEGRLRDEGLAERFTLCGIRSDVPRILLGAIDLFLFPSLFEGLPLTLMETQAAGLLCVYSDVITPEASVVRELMRPVPLDAPASVWADTVLGLREAPPSVTQDAALAAMERTDFNILRGVDELVALCRRDGSHHDARRVP